MSGITNNPHRLQVELDLSSFAAKPRDPTAEKQKAEARQDPFLSLTDQEDTCKKKIAAAASNCKAICPPSQNTSHYAKEITTTADKMGALSDPNLPQEIEWLEIKATNGETVFVHFDKKNGKIGFFGENLSKEPTLHSFTNSTGEVEVELYFPIYSAYRAAEKKRLRDPELLKKIQLLNDSKSSEEIRETLINYLGAKKETIDPPSKNPLFYKKASSETEFLNDSAPQLLAVMLFLRKSGPLAEIEKLTSRFSFLSKLDAFSKKLQLFEEGQGSLGQIHQALDEMRKPLQAIGFKLNQEKLLSEEEKAHLVASLEKFHEISQKLIFQNEEKKELVTLPALENVEVVFNENLAKEKIDVKKKVRAVAAQTSENKPEVEASQDKLVDYVANKKIREEEIKKISALCSSSSTIVQGLKNLNRQVLEDRKEGIPESDIFSFIALSLPVLTKKDYANLDKQTLQEVENELLKLSEEHFHLEKRRSIGPGTGIHHKLFNSLSILSMQLIGHNAMHVFSVKTNSDQKNYLLEKFHSLLENNLFLPDDRLQKKAVELVSEAFRQEPNPLSALIESQSENSLSLHDRQKYFKSILYKICLQNLSAEKKESLKCEWQKIELAQRWMNAIQNHIVPRSSWILAVTPFVKAETLKRYKDVHHDSIEILLELSELKGEQLKQAGAAIEKVIKESSSNKLKHTKTVFGEPFYTYQDPSDQDLIELFLLAHDVEEIKDTLKDDLNIFTPVWRAILLMHYDGETLPPANILDSFKIDAEEEKPGANTTPIYRYLRERLKDYAIENLISGGGQRLGFFNFEKVRKKINDTANEMNFEEGSSIKKEFKEIFSEPRDLIWRSFLFIKKFPAFLSESKNFQNLLNAIFSYQCLDYAIEGEINGNHQFISKQIPQHLNTAIAQLISKMNDEASLDDEKREATKALGNILLIAYQLKSYLETKKDNEKSSIDLSAYENYLDLYIEHLAKNLTPEMAGPDELSKIAGNFLRHISQKDLANGQKHIQDAVFFYLSAVHFEDLNEPDSLKREFYESLKASPNYSKKVLETYFLFETKSPLPEGLKCDFLQNEIEYEGNKLLLSDVETRVELPKKNRGWQEEAKPTKKQIFKLAIKELNIPLAQSKWYLEDISLNDYFKKNLGKPLSFLPIKQEGSLFKIEHTPFSFDEDGHIYFELEKGQLLRKIELENPLAEFGLAHQFDPLQDECFESLEAQKIFVIRKSEPRYCKEGNTVVRVKDLNICLPNEELNGFTVWREINHPGSSQYKARTVEKGHPFTEFHLIEKNAEMSFESKSHPGFYLSNTKPICRGVDLTRLNVPHIVLENAENELLLISEINGKNVEVFIRQDSMQTGDPWDLFMLLITLGDPSLLEYHLKAMKLNPPKDLHQKLAADHLHDFVKKVPEAKLFASWLYALNLDLAVFGNSGGISSMTLEEVNAVSTAYGIYRNNCALYPELRASKEIERLFLVEFKRYIDKSEAGLREKIKNLKKINTSPTLMGRLQKLFRPSSEEVKEAEMQLAYLRISYRKWLYPMTEARETYLQSGASPKKNQSWIKLIDPFKLFNFKKEATKDIVAPLITKLNELSQKNSPSFKSWTELKNEFESTSRSKSGFVNEHIADFYHAAKSLKGKEKIELLEWLDLRTSSDIALNWLSKVGKTPGRYLSIDQLIKQVKKQQKEVTKLSNKISKLQKKLQIYLRLNRSEVRKIPLRWQLRAAKNRLEKLPPIQRRQLEKKLFPESVFTLIKKSAETFFKLLKIRMQSSSLKIKQVKLERPYFIFKKRSDRGNLSIVSAVDEKFDQFFDQWKEKLLEEQLISSANDQRSMSSDEPIIQSAQEKIDTYRKNKNTTVYTVKENSDFQDLKNDLKEKIEECKKLLLGKERDLLFLANSAASHSETLRHLLKGRPLDWKDLTRLVYKGQEWAYYKHLADPSKITPIQNGFYEYLAIRTRLYQMERLDSELQGELTGKSLSKQKVQKLGAIFTEKRAYPIAGSIDPKDYQLLFFEAASPKGLFKKEQYQKIRELSDGKVKLSEMPTGFGKTDYIIPMLNERMKLEHDLQIEQELQAQVGKKQERKKIYKASTAKLKRLALNIWPDALLKINKSAIEKKTSLATSGRVQLLSFSRGTRLDSTNLERLLYRLEKAAEKGEPISVRASDIASLRLHWIETLEEVHKGNASVENVKCAEFYGKIVRCLLTTSIATIDESHEILDPMQKTIFTLGYEQEVPEFAIHFATGFFACLMKNETFKTIIEENAKLKPEELQKVPQEIFNENTLKEIASFIGIQNVDLEEFEGFLKGEKELNPSWEIDRAKLFLASGYYKVIVNALLSGRFKENFGLSARYYESHPYAIPYLKKDMPKESEDNDTPSSYQNIDETLLKTIRCYVTDGLSQENLVELALSLIRSFRQEKESNPHTPKLLLPSYRELLDLFAKAGIPQVEAEKLISTSHGQSNERMRAVFSGKKLKRLQKDYAVISLFVKSVAAAKMKIYPLSIAVTPQDLLEMIKESVSVSATPQAKQVHSLRTEFIELALQSGKMLNLLMTKIVDLKTTPDNFIEGVVASVKKEHVRAIVDPSGLQEFDLKSVKKMAEELEKANAGLEHIVFFDVKEDKFLSFNIKDQTLHPFNLKSHKPEVSLTLYDQARSVGTDIFQAPKAKVLLLLSKNTTSSQAAQAAGRMRQLEGGQRIIAWTKEPLKNASLDEAISKTVEGLIQNELSVSLQKNKVCFEQMMASDLKGTLVRKMLGIPVDGSDSHGKFDVNEMMKKYGEYRQELVDEIEYDPVISYGAIGKEKTGEEVLKAHHKKLSEKAAKYLKGAEKKIVQDRLDQYKPLWEEVPLPEKDYGFDAGTTQEISAELATHKDVSISTEVEVSVIKPDQKHVDWMNTYVWPESVAKLFKMKFENNQEGLAKKAEARKLQLAVAKALADTRRGKGFFTQVFGTRRLKRLQAKQQKLFPFIPGSKDNPVEFFRAKDVLAEELPSTLQSGTQFFEDNFLLSSNFSDQTYENSVPLVTAFRSKPLSHILLTLEILPNGKKEYKAICIDANDAKKIHTLLDVDAHDTTQGPRNKKIGIYSLDQNGLVHQGKDHFTEDELNDSAVFALSAQAKLISGNTSYEKKEKEYYEKKIRQINASITNQDSFGGKTLFEQLVRKLSPIDRQKEKGRFIRLLEM